MTDSGAITSVQNPKVKAAVKLHQAKARQETGLILIEGRHPVEEAIATGLQLTQLFLPPDEALPPGLSADTEVFRCTPEVMARLATTDSPPPHIAVAHCPEAAWDWQHIGTSALVLALVGLQDPGNVGTLIRSACAFGVDGLVMVGPSADPYQPKVVRSSAGLVFRLPILKAETVLALQARLTDTPDGTWCCLGAHAHQGSPYTMAQYDGRCLLLLGSEGAGLPEDVWAFAQPVHIPMAPGAESLNVGVAGGILLAAAFMQRTQAR